VDGQRTGLQARVDLGQQRARVTRAQRLDAQGRPRGDHPGARRTIAQRRQQRGLDEREIAGDADDRVAVVGRGQRGLDPAQRPRPGDAIGDDLDAQRRPRRRIVRDREHARERRAQQRQLPLGDGAAADGQERLRDAAQPPRRAARDDRARDLHLHGQGDFSRRATSSRTRTNSP
jgi:hypothetical protein